MHWEGSVVAIHVAPDAGVPMQARENVEAVAGEGIRGDRYFDDDGTFSHVPGNGRDITLTEVEAIEAVEREYDIDIGFGDHRRNVTTRGAPLNHLVDERFRVGEAICDGIRLCEPCVHLQKLTVDGIEEALTHRGGLRADIVESGRITTGDSIEPLSPR